MHLHVHRDMGSVGGERKRERETHTHTHTCVLNIINFERSHVLRRPSFLLRRQTLGLV